MGANTDVPKELWENRWKDSFGGITGAVSDPKAGVGSDGVLRFDMDASKPEQLATITHEFIGWSFSKWWIGTAEYHIQAGVEGVREDGSQLTGYHKTTGSHNLALVMELATWSKYGACFCSTAKERFKTAHKANDPSTTVGQRGKKFYDMAKKVVDFICGCQGNAGYPEANSIEDSLCFINTSKDEAFTVGYSMTCKDYRVSSETELTHWKKNPAVPGTE